MKKLLIGLYSILLIFLSVPASSMSDCEYFVFPLLGSNHYTECLKNPDTYSSYFVYHTVDFYSESTLIESKQVRDRENVLPPTNPIRTGYEFVGWDTVLTNVRSDRTINAVWKQMVLLTYINYDGTILKQEVIEPGGTGSPPTPPIRNGFTFTGWSNSYINVSYDTSFIAQYSATTFTVKFYSNDNTVIDTQIINYKYDATTPPPPFVEGKVFTGWSTSYQNVTSDLNVYALYDDLYYSIQFHYDNLTDTVQSIHGSVPVAPSVMKTGYDFLGWEPSLTTATSNMSYTAKYAKHKYTVVFYDQNNTILETQFIEYQGTAEQPAYQEPEGINLLGWSETLTNIQSDLSVYPIFDVASYHIRYELEDGSLFLEEDVLYGNTCLLEMPVRIGFEFSHLSNDCSNLTGDTVIIAYYTPIQFLVQFFNFADEVVSSQMVNYGEDAIAPLPSDIPRYVVTGWSSNFTNIEENTDLYPSGYVRTYQIMFKDYDGSDLCFVEAEYGQVVSCPEPTRDGFLFESWTESLTVTGNKTVFPVYVKKEFRIDYFIFNQLLKTEIVPYQQSGSPPFVSRTGYDFIEWSSSIQYVTKDLIVYAILEKQSFEVVFKDYDFSNMKIETVEYGKDATPPIVERKGYRFVGWSGSEKDVTSDLSLIATYEPLQYTVSFYYGDSLLKTEEVLYLESASEPEINLPGVTILGWSSDFQIVEDNLTIYLMTENEKFTVKFYEDESLLKEDEVEYGKSASSPFTAEWSTDFSYITEDLSVYLIDRDYPAELYGLVAENTEQITYFDHLGSEINTSEYSSSQDLYQFQLTGYHFLDWDITPLEGGNYIAKPVLEVDTSYLELKPLLQMSIVDTKNGLIVFMKEGFENYIIAELSMFEEILSLDEVTYQFDDYSKIDKLINWILLPDVRLSDVEYIKLQDINTQQIIYYDLRMGAEPFAYNIIENKIILSPWNKFLIWLDLMM